MAKSPFEGGLFKLTSAFGYRTHPISGAASFHGGVDLVSLNGGNVAAVCGGSVIRCEQREQATDSGKTWQWGLYVAVACDDGTTQYYCHLSSASVKVGQRVEAGDIIGVEGSTGYSTGNHLHYEVRSGGNQINAADYLGISNAVGVYGSAGVVKTSQTVAAVQSAPSAAPSTVVEDAAQLIGEHRPDEIQLIANGCDITAAAVSLKLTSSLDTLGDKLTFSIPWSDIARYNIDDLNVGGKVTLLDYYGSPAFEGIITMAVNSENERCYTCYDFCYYLNKSKITVQFAEITVAQAIGQLWDMLGVKYVTIGPLNMIVSETNYLDTPSGILSKLLSREEDVSGVKYFVRAERFHTINIERYGGYETKTPLIGISSPKHTTSLDDVRNAATYVVSQDDGYYEYANAENSASIAKYGRIADVYVAESEEDVTNAGVIVANIVNKNGEPLPTGTLTVKGHFWAMTGKRLTITEPVTGFSGEYVIESVSHSWSSTAHLMELAVKRYSNPATITAVFGGGETSGGIAGGDFD